MKSKYPEIRFGESSADDEGFYVDTDKDDGQVSVDQLEELASDIAKVVKAGESIEREVVDRKKH